MDSTLYESVGELFADVSLVGDVSDVNLAFYCEAHVFGGLLFTVGLVNSDFGYTVVSVILKVAIIVDLELVVKDFVVSFVDAEGTVRKVLLKWNFRVFI